MYEIHKIIIFSNFPSKKFFFPCWMHLLIPWAQSEKKVCLTPIQFKSILPNLIKCQEITEKNQTIMDSRYSSLLHNPKVKVLQKIEEQIGSSDDEVNYRPLRMLKSPNGNFVVAGKGQAFIVISPI